MAHSNDWHSTWYQRRHAASWERVKESIRRDWQQTRHDLHAGGHELNQSGMDTLKQASGAEAVPSINNANPPRVIGEIEGEWEKVKHSVEYGYAARSQFGQTHADWNDSLAENLREEWETGAHMSRECSLWDDVEPYVRYGYERRI